MSQKIREVQHLTSTGAIILTSSIPSLIGPVKIALENGRSFNGTYEGKDLAGFVFKGKLTYEAQSNFDSFKGTLTCADDYFLFESKGTLTYKDMRTYTGTFEMGKRHGTATFTWPEGDRFEGKVTNDKLDEGIMNYSSGNRYIGQFNAAGEEDGRGTFFFPSGEIRVGTWSNGNLVNGWIWYRNRDYFKGELYGDENDTPKRGEFHFVELNEGYYKGSFNVNGEPHGPGTWHFPSGDVVGGNWINGDIKYGRIDFSNGDVFHGEFDGRRKVNGSLTLKNGDTYTGGFLNDLPEGKGLLCKSDGSVFDGYFLRGMRSGIGRTITPEGVVESGEWEKGILRRTVREGQREGPMADRVPANDHDDIPWASTIS